MPRFLRLRVLVVAIDQRLRFVHRAVFDRESLDCRQLRQRPAESFRVALKAFSIMASNVSMRPHCTAFHNLARAEIVDYALIPAGP
jgi:hypothetical protein